VGFLSKSHLTVFWEATDGVLVRSNVDVVAPLFDISCLYGKPEFATIQNDAYNDWVACSSFEPLELGLLQDMKDHFGLTLDGIYYFVNQNGNLVPVWDLTSSGPYAGNTNAIVYAQKFKTAPSPSGPANIDRVELKKLSGGLANVIYRVDTVQGQPPSTVNSSFNFCLSHLINVYIFVVQTWRFCNCQICGEVLYVSMTW
jgi:hypothetical protein